MGGLITALCIGLLAGGVCAIHMVWRVRHVPDRVRPWLSILGVALLLAGPSRCMANEQAEVAQASTGDTSVVHVRSEEHFEQTVADRGKLFLVDFYSDWCSPCRMISGTLAELAAKHADDVVVAKVDVDKFGPLGGRYGVRSLPHLVLVRNGKVLASRTGYARAKVLDKWVRRHK